MCRDAFIQQIMCFCEWNERHIADNLINKQEERKKMLNKNQRHDKYGWLSTSSSFRILFVLMIKVEFFFMQHDQQQYKLILSWNYEQQKKISLIA